MHARAQARSLPCCDSFSLTTRPPPCHCCPRRLARMGAHQITAHAQQRRRHVPQHSGPTASLGLRLASRAAPRRPSSQACLAARAAQDQGTESDSAPCSGLHDAEVRTMRRSARCGVPHDAEVRTMRRSAPCGGPHHAAVRTMRRSARCGGRAEHQAASRPFTFHPF